MADTEQRWTALDAECEECRGRGEVSPDYYCPPRWVECQRCDGHGRIPTEFGEAVLAFILDRLKLSSRVERH